MSPNSIRLRQQHLLIRSSALRHTLSDKLQSLERPAAWADHLRTSMVWLSKHPQWPALGLLLLLVLKPSRFMVWGGRLWWLWRSARTLRRMRDVILVRLSHILPS